jgi:type II secretory pathway pseudopilin PulG
MILSYSDDTCKPVFTQSRMNSLSCQQLHVSLLLHFFWGLFDQLLQGPLAGILWVSVRANFQISSTARRILKKKSAAIRYAKDALQIAARADFLLQLSCIGSPGVCDLEFYVLGYSRSSTSWRKTSNNSVILWQPFGALAWGFQRKTCDACYSLPCSQKSLECAKASLKKNSVG